MPFLREPHPPEPPAKNPPIVAVCLVEGYIKSSNPIFLAASSSLEILMPASVLTEFLLNLII